MNYESIAMRAMRLEIAGKLLKMDDRFRELGISMSNLTLIARDPANDNMFVCVTNETDEGLQKATALALTQNCIEQAKDQIGRAHV